MIPKIIHQIAPRDKTKWHPLWFPCRESWLNCFNGFEFKLWNDENDIDNLIKTNFSSIYGLFKTLTHIDKINVAKFCILDTYGGIYADMDVFCYKNFYNEIMNEEICFNESKFLEYGNTSFLIDHSLIVSKKKSLFWRSVLDMFYEDNIFLKNNTEQCSGSFLLQKAAIKSNQNIFLFDPFLYNNITGSYDKSFVTKHVRTYRYNSEPKTNIIIAKGLIINETASKNLLTFFKSNNIEYDILTFNNFNFFFDYSKNNFFTKENYLQLNYDIAYFKHCLATELNKVDFNYS